LKTTRKPFIAGNWKMNLNLSQAIELVKAVGSGRSSSADADILVAPPFTALYGVRQEAALARLFLGAQNMHWDIKGAYTGEISGRMLQDAGCTHVILGHSERRTLFGEKNDFIDLKVKAAVLIGLIPIVCIGETLEERESGNTFKVIEGQLEGSLRNFLEDSKMPRSTILAYEPVWAIGTGRNATPQQAQEVHSFIRGWISDRFDKSTSEEIRILYGGSVTPANIKDLMNEPDIDGALVGGASLKAETFLPIVNFMVS
jgi:triosephosphate isomerase